MNPRCVCGGKEWTTAFTYDAPPAGEVRFRFSAVAEYRRKVLRCPVCGHFVSVHAMDDTGLYQEDYVSAHYGWDGIHKAFERIVSLPPEQSDNVGRVRRILDFAAGHLVAPAREGRAPTVLDVGSGLCVFHHRMKAAGWDGTALDRDPRLIAHARDVVGVRGICGDFATIEGVGQYDVVTFNKVLEHVKDPIGMLARAVKFLHPGGFVYAELPDGEAAIHEGPGREEFFIEHHHVFSLASASIVAERAGFLAVTIERLREPSTKFTLRAFLVPRTLKLCGGEDSRAKPTVLAVASMGNKITDCMSGSISMTEQERLTALVYGDTFSLYDEKTFDEFVEPLYMRLKANGISSHVFKGKRCLDAGCGGGRGSILMAQCGAREVIGVDLSATNIESCRKRAVQKGFPNLGFQQGSLMELPFAAESFDVVWCNGVLHHLTDPDQGLKEITRVLKTGGQLWLYVYGSGGIYWYTVDWIRAALRGVDVRECIIQLRLMDAPVRRIAEWIDDWFAPYLRRYTETDVTNRLIELGYEDAEPLRPGVGYDTSQRRVGACAEELAFMGEGDLRFFCHKAGAVSGSRYALPDPPDGKGSPYVDGPVVAQFAAPLGRIAAGLTRLQSKHGHEIAAYKVIVCRSVHNKVRNLLEAKAPFDAQTFQEHLGVLGNLLEQFGVSRERFE